jgi:hypothetical protein
MNLADAEANPVGQYFAREAQITPTSAASLRVAE